MCLLHNDDKMITMEMDVDSYLYTFLFCRSVILFTIYKIFMQRISNVLNRFEVNQLCVRIINNKIATFVVNTTVVEWLQSNVGLNKTYTGDV